MVTSGVCGWAFVPGVEPAATPEPQVRVRGLHRGALAQYEEHAAGETAQQPAGQATGEAEDQRVGHGARYGVGDSDGQAAGDPYGEADGEAHRHGSHEHGPAPVHRAVELPPPQIALDVLVHM